MTGRDPAAEAAQRASMKDGRSIRYRGCAEAGARAALDPIRELHKPVMESRTALHPEPACSCGNGADWRGCPTARWIYTDEELEP